MAAVVARRSGRGEERVMDTRTPSPSPSHSSTNGGSEGYKPDLSKEVAMLSTKLVNAINYQTNLDDTLQATRHELEQARQDLQKIRAEKQKLDDAVTEGVLMKKAEVDATIAKLKAELAEEKEKRDAAEKVKRQTESEVETLTSTLFEQANNMVAEARRDTDAAERRTSQLRSQLSDTETLLASQQEQLQDLKSTMEALERTASNAPVAQRDSSNPSTPINTTPGAFEALQFSPGPEPAAIEPNHPLHFSQLLQPMLRNDVGAYSEFVDLLAAAKKAAPHSRNASGNMATATSTLTSTSTTTPASSAATASSSPNIPGSFAFSNSSSPSSTTFATTAHPAPPLKETKFYKRILLEDLEPTLRLDLAPGLSFLSRRAVFAALLNGTLFVEPFAPSSTWKLYAPVFPCSLCAESRKVEPYIRRHRFRTAESEDAVRYPLCDYCVARLRASGDFMSFLRMVREGVWRCEGEEGERQAWEEAVRLRERMFWTRVAGGVVPAVSGAGLGVKSSPVKARVSLEGIPEQRSRRSTAVEDRESAVERQSDDVFRERADSEATTGSKVDEPEAREARANELKRRTMLHMGENPAVAALAAQDSTASDDEDDETTSSSQQEQEQASEQLQQEAVRAEDPVLLSPLPTPSSEDDGMVSAEEEPSTPPPVPEHRNLPRSPEKSDQRPSPLDTALQNSGRSGSDTGLASPASLTAPRPSGDGRRPSAVLARVRAMEAKATNSK